MEQSRSGGAPTQPLDRYVSTVSQSLAVFRFLSFALGAGLVFAINALRGDNTTDFWKYQVSSGTWSSLSSVSGNVEHGGSLATDGADVYALRGNKLDDFWKFDVGSGSWSSLSDTPQNVEYGGALAYLDGVFYALRGDGRTDFWKYQ